MVDVIVAAPELALPADSVIRRIMDEIAAHPEVREPLLRTLLTEDFLALPVLVKEQGERIDDLAGEMRAGFQRLDDRIDGVRNDLRSEMHAGFQRLDDRIDGVRDELGNRIDGVRDELKDEIREAREETRKVSREVSILRGRLGRMFGDRYEDVCRANIDAILVPHLYNPNLVDLARFRYDMQQIRMQGIISGDEYKQLRAIDIVAGDAEADGTVVKYAVVEVSYTVNNDDIDKAAARRDILRRGTGVPTDAFFITANDWPERLAEYAAGKGVTVIKHEYSYDDDW